MQKTEGTNLRVAYYAARRLVASGSCYRASAPLHALDSVHGHSMCLRRKSEDDPSLSFKVPQETRNSPSINTRSGGSHTPRIESDAVFSPPTGGHALSIDQENDVRPVMVKEPGWIA